MPSDVIDYEIIIDQPNTFSVPAVEYEIEITQSPIEVDIIVNGLLGEKGDKGDPGSPGSGTGGGSSVKANQPVIQAPNGSRTTFTLAENYVPEVFRYRSQLCHSA